MANQPHLTSNQNVWRKAYANSMHVRFVIYVIAVIHIQGYIAYKVGKKLAKEATTLVIQYC